MNEKEKESKYILIRGSDGRLRRYYVRDGYKETDKL